MAAKIAVGVRFEDTPIYDNEFLTELELSPLSSTKGDILLLQDGTWGFLWLSPENEWVITQAVTDEALALPRNVTNLWK